MSGNIPYIGSKISLITTSDIRYEGILYTLNREESTIAVQNVRSFGTEGRRYPEVPMSNEIYDFIIFRGKDLKDLTVLQGAPERPAAFAVGSSDLLDSQGSSAYSQQAPQSDVYGGTAMAAAGGYLPKPSAIGAGGLGPSVRNGYLGASSSASCGSYAGQGMAGSPYGSPGGYAAGPYQSPGASGSRPVEVKPFTSGTVASSSAGTAGGLGMPGSVMGGIATSSGFASASNDLSHRVAPPIAASAAHSGLGMGVGASSVASRQPFLSPMESSGISGLGDALGRVPPRGFEEPNGVQPPRTPETKAPPGVKRPEDCGPSLGSKEDKSARGRGKGGAQKKPLFEVLRFHKRAEETIMKAMKSLNSSNLAPNELRSMSEMNPSVYHFYLDFVNYCCPSHTLQSDEQQWETLCKALKKHFEKDFGSNQNQKPAQPQRPNNTLGDFITIETSKKGTKAATKVARGGGGGGGRVGGGRGRGDKKDQLHDFDGASGFDEGPLQSSSWNCPRCTLRNENLLMECAACGTSKQQAALWAEFPPLG